jgi:hypothetical protein
MWIRARKEERTVERQGWNSRDCDGSGQDRNCTQLSFNYYLRVKLTYLCERVLLVYF